MQRGAYRGSWIGFLPGRLPVLASFLLLIWMCSSGCTSRPSPPLVVQNPSEAPQPKVAPVPPYPRSARDQRIFGRIMANILVDAEGRVAKVEFPPGTNMELSQSVERTLQNWRFTPARNNGHPVATWVHIPFDFHPPY